MKSNPPPEESFRSPILTQILDQWKSLDIVLPVFLKLNTIGTIANCIMNA